MASAVPFGMNSSAYSVTSVDSILLGVKLLVYLWSYLDRDLDVNTYTSNASSDQ